MWLSETLVNLSGPIPLICEMSGSVTHYTKGFPGGSVVKNLPATAGDVEEISSIPGLGRSPGEEHGNPLQYSCLVNLMDREVWWATVHGVTKTGTTEPLMHPTHYQPLLQGEGSPTLP